MKLMGLFALLGAIISLSAQGGTWRDYAEFIGFTGQPVTITWMSVDIFADSVDIEIDSIERSADITTVTVPSPATSYAWTPTRSGHYVIKVASCSGSSATRVCSAQAASTDPVYARTGDGLPRAFIVSVFVAPPTGGGVN